MTSAITLQGVYKTFAEVVALHDVTLKCPAQTTTVIMGPSGAGKSTLVRCCAGLTQPDRGQVRCQGRVGVVFQAYHLFPHLSVVDNVALAPMHVGGMQAKRAHEVALQQLAQVGLESKASAYPAALSGGEKQRTAIARALAMQPNIMLFDEPTSALDPALTTQMVSIMQQLRAQGMTLLVNTHQVTLAQRIADFAVVLERGRVVEFGPARQVFESPQHACTRSLLA